MPQTHPPSPSYPTFDQLRSRRLAERRDVAIAAAVVPAFNDEIREFGRTALKWEAVKMV
ncbi:hypothetical protein N825_16135 [Skermanella stibiiresistens SB22]|uniref:Uncharacterized protein n=1 Tax=Skermanella stibiiresistens SB22 TaxID=1385369 RepID=W9GZ94_9PROT|nr:hypothetical protein [Skermanella stibiiresistens]EWY37931.1 hypothetical protein N825_16135 [Skermanella stibiiresistens SB22]